MHSGYLGSRVAAGTLPESWLSGLKNASPGQQLGIAAPAKSVVELWKRPGNKGVSAASASARMNKEHHILPALKLGCNFPELVFAVHWLLVYLDDDHSRGESQIVTEGVWLHVHYLNALAFRCPGALCHLWRYRFYRNAEFRRRRLIIFRSFARCSGLCDQQTVWRDQPLPPWPVFPGRYAYR